MSVWIKEEKKEKVGLSTMPLLESIELDMKKFKPGRPCPRQLPEYRRIQL